MAEKVTPFKHHRSVELIMSSPDPSTHKRVGRGVRNLVSAVWDREKQMPWYLATTPKSHRIPP